MKTLTKACALSLAMGVGGMAQAGELPNIESMQGLQFNFAPPGARSMGMGGAFLGRADDATAAFANPAGLTNLFTDEISLEIRSLDFDTEYSAGGNYPDIDRQSTSSDTTNMSYLSFVAPGENWVFAGYLHQYMDFNTAFDTDLIGLGSTFTFPTSNSIDMDIFSYSAAFAYRVSDRVSLGANVSFYRYRMSAITNRFGADGETPVNNQVQNGSDNDFGFNIGALFQLTDNLSMGLVYRSSAQFKTNHVNSVGSADAPGFVFFERDFEFEIPDMYGIGFSWQPTDSLTFNLDVNRVNYSKLADPVFWAFSGTPDADRQLSVDKMFIDDVTTVHFGGEYVFNAPVAIRAGVWHDPDHLLTFDNPPELSGDINRDRHQLANSAFFQGGDDVVHFALGIGIFFSNFQLDAAADFSDVQNSYSISGVWRFE